MSDWRGKVFGSFKGEVRNFNRDTSLFYIKKDNYTAFYNWDGQLTGVYRGEVFYFKADNQHVVMRIPYGNYGGCILETRRLYKSIHEFMQHEVAELTPEERVQYGVDDFVKQ